MRNKRELQKYFIDIFARVSQVIFTLLIVTPFIVNIANRILVGLGIVLFGLVVAAGALTAVSIEEVK